MKEKEYKYRQYKIYIPVHYAKLIETLDSYSIHMRDKVILETLQEGLVLDNGSGHKRLGGNAQGHEQEAAGQPGNDEILKMLAALNEKIETLEQGEAAGANESRKETADKKSREKGNLVTDAEKRGAEPAPDVPDEVLDFFAND